MMIDTHCHLFWDSFYDDLEDVLDRADSAGVAGMLVPSTNFDTMTRAAGLAEGRPSILCAAGIHPQDTASLQNDYIERLKEFIAGHEVAAIGEIGLDYFREYSPPGKQRRALEEQLELALEMDLPVIIHNRSADDDLLAICREFRGARPRGQFHCFSSTPEFAEHVIDMGFHISFTGNVTYKKSLLDEVVRIVPDERLLLETDAPFMAPMPHRGKRNEPAYLTLIAGRLAEIRGQETAKLAAFTSANAVKLYGFKSYQESANAGPAAV